MVKPKRLVDIAAIIGVIFFIAIVVYLSNKEEPKDNQQLSNVNAAQTIYYNDGGFDKASVTIAKGETVKFVNNTDNDLWVASDPHPRHTDLPGFDALGRANDEYVFTFDKAGTWKYHNHSAASREATVVVTE